MQPRLRREEDGGKEEKKAEKKIRRWTSKKESSHHKNQTINTHNPHRRSCCTAPLCFFGVLFLTYLVLAFLFSSLHAFPTPAFSHLASSRSLDASRIFRLRAFSLPRTSSAIDYTIFFSFFFPFPLHSPTVLHRYPGRRVLAAFCGCVPHWYKILETRCVLMLQQNKSYKSVSCWTSPQFISNLWLRLQLCVTPPSISIFSSPHSYLCFLLPPVLLSPRIDNVPSIRPSPPPLLSTSLWAGEHCEGWATVLVGGRALTFWCVPFFSCHGLCLILLPSLDGENRACFFVCSGRGLLGKRW